MTAVSTGEREPSSGPPLLLDSNYWAEITDPDDPGYLRGTAMRED